VASLPVLLEYCLPFVKVGGCFIAMKGNSTEEVENSKKALEILGERLRIFWNSIFLSAILKEMSLL